MDQNLILGYLQIIAGIFVFGIGVPTLLSNLPELEKNIRDRHAFISYNGLNIIGICVTGLSALLMILYLMGFFTSINCEMLSLTFSKYICLITWNHIMGLCIIFNFLIAGLFWHRLISYQHKDIGDWLCEKCLENFRKDSEFNDDDLYDLGALGKGCASGKNTDNMLMALSKLIKGIDSGSESLLRIMEVIEQTTHQGTLENYITSIEIFNEIIPKLSDQELSKALDILKVMGIQAFNLDARRVETVLLETVSTIFEVDGLLAIRTLFSWYKASMEKQRYQFAIGILDKTSALVLDFIQDTNLLEEDDESIEIIGVYLGMLAYLHNSSGAAQALAVQRLNILKESFLNVITFIHKAKEHFAYNEADFTTADMLERLYKELIQKGRLARHPTQNSRRKTRTSSNRNRRTWINRSHQSRIGPRIVGHRNTEVGD